MKLINTLSILLFCLALNIQAQETLVTKSKIQPCLLKLESAPKFRGIRLDMTKTEIKKEYPSMVFTEDFPAGSIDRNTPAGIARKPQITNLNYKANLEEISVLFSKENKTLTAVFTFENSAYGASVKDLSDKFSEFLNLPKNQWQPSRGGGNSLSVYCDGFAISVDFTKDQKPLLFMAKAPDKLTSSEKEIIKPSN